MDNMLTPVQEKLIINLLSCNSIEEACKKNKTSKASFYKWLKKDENFKHEYNKRKIELVDNSMVLLTSSVSKAVDVLTKLLDTDNEHLRRLVAKDIIEHSIKVVEIEKLEKRIEEIETVIKK